MKLTMYDRSVFVELTRRNLEALLMKLDLPEGESACTISKPSDDQKLTLFVKAVEDEQHYEQEGRPAGMMHPREERKLTKPTTGVVFYH